MKAFVVDRYKGKSAVRLGEMPEPEVRDDDVLVQVHSKPPKRLGLKRTPLGGTRTVIEPESELAGNGSSELE